MLPNIYLSRLLCSLFATLTLVFSPLASAGLFDSLGGSNSSQPLPVEQAYRLHAEAVAPGQLDLVWQIQPRLLPLPR